MTKIINSVVNKLSQSGMWETAQKERDQYILIEKITGKCALLSFSNYASNFIVLGVHIGMFELNAPTLKSAWSGNLHQRGQKILRDHWIWLPRLHQNGPASYEVKYLLSQKQYIWKINRVGHGTDSPFTQGRSYEGIVDELANRLNQDFETYSDYLTQKLL